ncbi:GNAT family N-acetyltransferase [Nostoc sp. FACHB-152]|uniref:GNAT family N-acetyltransferase n=1 Tax=Nostoc sp. FACHB-152 TaxID=2692837 RepID=UPI0016830ADF|nr:GNAT family N-acetyltransferase [Nostoc sp. FACHB-152]MBD2451110.1 GNAT family N-acetyltransferase [Nostoc sp. FACHB-152]
MCLSNVVIERANPKDVDGILELAQANEVEHGGMLVGHLEREAVSKTISQMPSIVARKDSQVVGFLLSWSKSSIQIPLITTMLQAYPGKEDAYLYGPICVEETMRGQGIAASMFAKLKNFLPQKQGILFIKANNEPSLRAHRKMGMSQMVEFTYDDTRFFVFAYDG